MPHNSASGAGTISSADIAVPEHERETRFYARVLTTGETPLWREDLMNALGVPVIGLGARSEAYEQLPLQWMPHIQVADVAASAARAADLGGRELMHGRDEQGQSQWAVMLDPFGAAFGLIPVVPAEAIPPAMRDGADAAGRIAWLDLTVPDAPAACDFYRQVIGWSVRHAEMPDDAGRSADITMLDAGGRPAAGVCHAGGENEGRPPVWLIHLPVGDLAESLRRVVEEGGRVVNERRGHDGTPGVAVIEDPVGVFLALVPG